MLDRSLIYVFIVLAIVAVNLWHIFAVWFIRSYGLVPGALLLFTILLFAYCWED